MGIKTIRKSIFDNINQANALLYKMFSCGGMLNVTVKFLEINQICSF